MMLPVEQIPMIIFLAAGPCFPAQVLFFIQHDSVELTLSIILPQVNVPVPKI